MKYILSFTLLLLVGCNYQAKNFLEIHKEARKAKKTGHKACYTVKAKTLETKEINGSYCIEFIK